MVYTSLPAKMENEDKAEIPGFEGRYYITRSGKVLSAPNSHHKTTIELKPQEGRTGRADGYLRINLRDAEGNDNKWRLIHKMVAEAFVERPDGCNDVEHKNGNKLDNRAENLQWVQNDLIEVNVSSVSLKSYGWSKYGGERYGLVQETKLPKWFCQSCQETQTSEMPSYMFEFSTGEFIRICANCQYLKIKNQLTDLIDLVSLVRKVDSLW